MRPRATADLDRLSDPEFFAEMSTGMRAVLRNALSLAEDARSLAENGCHRSTALLSGLAEEEGAKYFVLLDAVRSTKGAVRANQLKRFNDHLAKGLYANYVSIAPASFGEVLNFLDGKRQSLYLDGPNDIDWIFRNQILQNREEIMYVDYVDMGDEHQWVEPTPPVSGFFRFCEPRSVSFANSLSLAGFDDPRALATIAELWRGVTFNPEDHWIKCHDFNNKTLHSLAERNLLTEYGATNAARIAWDWLFPLHSADLKCVEVKRTDLIEMQRSWVPEY